MRIQVLIGACALAACVGLANAAPAAAQRITVAAAGVQETARAADIRPDGGIKTSG